jgi:hypothetical protein
MLIMTQLIYFRITFQNCLIFFKTLHCPTFQILIIPLVTSALRAPFPTEELARQSRVKQTQRGQIWRTRAEQVKNIRIIAFAFPIFLLE